MSKKKETSVAKKDESLSKRFINKVQSEFVASVGHGAEFTSHEKQLASNLFVSTDNMLNEFEQKRLSKGGKGTPYTWSNINMQKFALDAVHRIRLGLDAMIPNHLHVVPYFNGRTKNYDLNLNVGYRGKHHYRVKMSTDDVVDIRYQLVHKNDHFKPLPKTHDRPIESYEFDITDPFDRGDVIGGFGYIIYENEKRNKLIIVTEKEFKKVKATAQTSMIWDKWGEKMRYKTLVHRTTDELDIDPSKVNPSYHYVEKQDNIFDDDMEIQQPAQRKAIDIPDKEPETQQDEGFEPPVAPERDIDEEIENEELPFG